MALELQDFGNSVLGVIQTCGLGSALFGSLLGHVAPFIRARWNSANNLRRWCALLYVCMYIYIYTLRSREFMSCAARQLEGPIYIHIHHIYICICIYIYIYIYLNPETLQASKPSKPLFHRPQWDFDASI